MLREGLLDEVVAHYREQFGERLVAIALYGSEARGTASEHSDIDLFLLIEGLPADRFERGAETSPPMLDVVRDPPVSIRALTPDEYARDVSALDLDIALDARILYDPRGLLGERLAILRQRIEEAGLERDEELFWRFLRPTRRDWGIHWDRVDV